jgi:hypothetical protein
MTYVLAFVLGAITLWVVDFITVVYRMAADPTAVPRGTHSGPSAVEVTERLMQGHRAYIEAALEWADGTYAYEDIVEAVAAGRMQFWPAPHSAVITELVRHPQMLTLHIFLAGGNLGEIAAMTPTVLNWGQSQGASVCYFTGRKGWAKSYLVKDCGFVDRGMVCLAKPLGGAEALE